MFKQFEKVEGKSFHLHTDFELMERQWAVPMWKVTYDEVEKAIENEESEIHTVQLCTLTGDLFEKGYRIFVYFRNSKGIIDRFEITLGECDRIDREVKSSMCLWHMLISGAFDLS